MNSTSTKRGSAKGRKGKEWAKNNTLRKKRSSRAKKQGKITSRRKKKGKVPLRDPGKKKASSHLTKGGSDYLTGKGEGRRQWYEGARGEGERSTQDARKGGEKRQGERPIVRKNIKPGEGHLTRSLFAGA